MMWLLDHKESQPKEVALLVPVDFPVVFNGNVAGSIRLPAGSVVKLISFERGTLVAANNGATATLPINATDLPARASYAMAHPVSPLPAPTPSIAAATQASPTPFTGFSDMDTNPSGSLADPQQAGKDGAFIHPGLLHTEADFRRMRVKVRSKAEPWLSGWNKLIANHHSSLSWVPRPQAVVFRGKGSPENYRTLYNDIAAAYALALRWKVTEDPAYAKKGIEICNAWSANLKAMDGNADRFLAVGIYGYEFANAAEILRTYQGWKREDFARFQQTMLTVFYPINHDFLLRHNGTKADHYWANWDGCNIASVIAIGVLCDKRSIYEEGVNYFKHGPGNGSIEHAVVYIHPGGLGQWQESGRDQGHTMMGIGLYGAICQMAWSQGDDLFGYNNNRFLAGAEYVAKYNSGEDAPYTPYADSSFKSPEISPGARGDARPVWELIYNHYVVLERLPAPYVTKMAGQSRPEGGGGDYGPNSGGFDQLGYGTLTSTLDPSGQGQTP